MYYQEEGGAPSTINAEKLREEAVNALLCQDVPFTQARHYVANATGQTVEEIAKNALTNWSADHQKPRPHDKSAKVEQAGTRAGEEAGNQPAPSNTEVLPVPDMSKRSPELIEMEDAYEQEVAQAAAHTIRSIEIQEQIHDSRRWHTELGYERWGDYYQARWGLTVKRYYQEVAAKRWWKETMLPALIEVGVNVSTMVDMPERAARPAISAPDPKATKASGTLDSKVIKSGIKKASDTRSQAQRELSALAVQAGRATKKEVRDQFFNDLYDQDPQPIPLDPAWWNAVVKEIQRFTLQAEQCGNIAEIASAPSLRLI
jgi:hypothetical protein